VQRLPDARDQQICRPIRRKLASISRTARRPPSTRTRTLLGDMRQFMRQ
jgi:hypothetical protein